MKQTPQKQKLNQTRRRMIAVMVSVFLLTVVSCASVFGYFVFKGREVVTLQAVTIETPEPVAQGPEPFPVGVDPSHKLITEHNDVETYFDEHISSRGGMNGAHTSWLGKAIAKLALSSWYQNMASLSSRVLVIQSGERREQIAQNFGKILGWDKATRAEFLALIASSTPELTEGKFFPGTYAAEREATPEDIASLVTNRFSEEVLSRYGDDVAAVVPLEDTLTIASLLEREAYDFDDMRHISGVIWNRLFVDMNLQIDATLQYAKGSRTDQPWWPKVRPADKYIKSPFNTYDNEGLPPTPIANPSLDAILAALNPRKTDCMYYFHDKNAGFHCTATYEEHVALLKQYYGRGK